MEDGQAVVAKSIWERENRRTITWSIAAAVQSSPARFGKFLRDRTTPLDI